MKSEQTIVKIKQICNFIYSLTETVFRPSHAKQLKLWSLPVLLSDNRYQKLGFLALWELLSDFEGFSVQSIRSMDGLILN
jgi:hypothetical protein